MFQSHNPALLVIDVQLAIDHFDTGDRNNPNAEKTIALLLKRWRKIGLPIAHICHASKFPDSPYYPHSPYFAFKPEVIPREGEPVFTKSENCAFIGTNLDEWLKECDIQDLVICGVLTNNSIDATVRVAAGLGYRVFVPEDATAAFPLKRLDGKHVPAEDVHWIFLSNLDTEYCRVCSAEELHR
ncbi:cysteine hydrolase [Microbulbifer salipaludis]|uniref:Cysteine hydrolase n=1 Tax=Microbulbifer salipaludis TaxID=187980 RepID=A0ABS3E2S3_9GAMM|nr:cysteine hydrolase family protein [Microbulbifer salipaludis]MBN8429589.1 cysteine hydrolase [Microbulbifer salipaludis]